MDINALIRELRERAESTPFDHQYVDVRKDELIALLSAVEKLASKQRQDDEFSLNNPMEVMW